MTKEKFDIERDKNRSFTYILPMLGEIQDQFKFLKQCFVGDSSKPNLKDKIFALYELNKENEWVEAYEKTLQSNELYHYHYKCDDVHTMYVFNLPIFNKENYFSFKTGKYSQFTDKYKRHVLAFHNLGMRSEVGKVLYRAEDKYVEMEKLVGQKIDRGQEIGNMPNKYEEVYNEEMKIFKKKEDNG